MKPRFILLFVVFIICKISYSQDTSKVFNKWSVGINYANFSYVANNLGNDFFGVAFEHRLFKNFYFKTGIEYNWRRKYKYTFDTNNGYKRELKILKKVLTIPTVLKWYFINNKNNTFQTFAILGINNRYSRDFSGSFSGNEEIINELGFYYVYGCGFNFNINRISIIIEGLYYAPNISKYNIGLTLNPYDFGIKAGISYLFK